MNIERKPIYIASCSFGKDSLATILLAIENNEPLDRVVFAEVMFDHKRNISGEHPEHIAWVYDVAIPKLRQMGIEVDVVKAKEDYVSVCSKRLREPKPNGDVFYGVQNCKPCYANSYLKLDPIKKYYRQKAKGHDVIQYVGIASDEPSRLVRLKGTNKISLLQKYGYTERMAMAKCKEYGLVSPIYATVSRNGCWFCFNAKTSLYLYIRNNYPHYWNAFRDLYMKTGSRYMQYGKTLRDVECEMDGITQQLSLF